MHYLAKIHTLHHPNLKLHVSFAKENTIIEIVLASCFPMLQVRWLSETISTSRFWFFSSLSSALFSSFAVYDQYITVETFFLCIIQPPLIKNCECFLCIFHHLQFSFENSSLIELSSFDLKVSQVSFLVKKKSVTKHSYFK